MVILRQVAQILQRPAHTGSLEVSFHFGGTPAGHLNDGTEFFVEQCLVKRAVFAHKGISHNFNADVAGKHHFTECRS